MTPSTLDRRCVSHTGRGDGRRMTVDEQQTGYVERKFQRDTRYLSDRITADGDESSGGWPVEAGRYRLIAARACPWASRAVIVRRLLGLEDALSLGLAGPTHDERSWQFDLDPGGRDPVLGIERLKEAFERRQPGYPLGITVPAGGGGATTEGATNGVPPLPPGPLAARQ